MVGRGAVVHPKDKQAKPTNRANHNCGWLSRNDLCEARSLKMIKMITTIPAYRDRVTAPELPLKTSTSSKGRSMQYRPRGKREKYGVLFTVMAVA
jgi:hypothetical protein